MAQAKHLTELDSTASTPAADVLEIDPESNNVTISLSQPKENANALDDAKPKMRSVQTELTAASKTSRTAVKDLRKTGLTVRELAKLMELSPGRVTQLEHHATPEPRPGHSNRPLPCIPSISSFVPCGDYSFSITEGMRGVRSSHSGVDKKRNEESLKE
ncbi:hypothetical protein [Glutamicibacter sp. Je.9.36]|uniref:hypothetical protein n=1 Tax=Glutamicibacter sp. Je.9.36 TaxID=3142837 RepID=UPI003DA985C5